MRDTLQLLSKDITRLSVILDTYEKELIDYDKHLQIKGKTIAEALKEQASYSAIYNEKTCELSTILKFLEGMIKQERSRLIRMYNENYNPALSERMIEKYIDNEDSYLKLHKNWIEVNDLLEKSKMITDAFNRRGFALRDLTMIYVNEIQGVIM
ncbi:MAG: hypothetical protein ACXW2E_00255 [Nitrososphaeraceae archaeon]